MLWLRDHPRCLSSHKELQLWTHMCWVALSNLMALTTNKNNIMDASVIAHCFTITESEIKGEDTDLASKCALDDLPELSTRNPSNDCHTASVSELNAPESHGSEESTVIVEYLAATIAMENECSGPFEGSEPTLTLLRKSVPDRKDIRIRPVSKRTEKTPKSRPKSGETVSKSHSFLFLFLSSALTATMADELILLDYWPSPFWMRLRIALVEEGINHEYKDEEQDGTSSETC
ncbi:hypothetical protein KIW84_044640 [Lathyrus oleraceus]|uniref:GST N-terminal domain-containing protein n=1 Tax=Pisum sativum TaxID=3888 RepID=A0A9D5AQM9_PEA|nr:hypothetical protein KIW84_044640 [Pisum sativum]